MAIFLFFPILIALSYIIIIVFVIVDIINNNDIDSLNKLFWIVLILTFGFIGLIVYWIIKDKNVLKESKK